MQGRLQINLPVDLDSIATATAAATDYLRARGASDPAVHFIHLAIDELLSNTVKYGFDTPPPDASVEITIQIAGGFATFEFSDTGKPFDPLAAPPPDLDTPLEHRSAGGLGIHFLRNMADHISYARLGPRNVLTIRKRIDA